MENQDAEALKELQPAGIKAGCAKTSNIHSIKWYDLIALHNKIHVVWNRCFNKKNYISASFSN